jgi:hypothetical protein
MRPHGNTLKELSHIVGSSDFFTNLCFHGRSIPLEYAATPQVHFTSFVELLMSRNLFAVTGVAVLLGLTLACTSDSSTPLTPTPPSVAADAAADGSTLKVSAPVAQSPVGGVKPSTGPATLVVSSSTALFTNTPALQYRFQVFNSANQMVENAVVNSPTHAVDAELTVNAGYTWIARAEYQGSAGPWSTRASFLAPETAFLNRELSDPLTNGKTVGQQHGGTFLPGQGWQSLSLFDGIDYDLTEPCIDNCNLQFDVTNFGAMEGEAYAKDLKWLSMGNAADFGDFTSFRNHPWKMHLIQRADFPTGMEIIWRNGDGGDGEPGDHRIKLNHTGIEFKSANAYHFELEWATTGFTIAVNGDVVMEDGWDNPYAPPVHRISLGCHPRGESFVGAIYKNVKLRKNR